MPKSVSVTERKRMENVCTVLTYVHLWPYSLQQLSAHLPILGLPRPGTCNEAKDLALDHYTKLAHGEELGDEGFEMGQATMIPVEHCFGVWDGVVLGGVSNLHDLFNQILINREEKDERT
jgi:hypothetical protein